MLIRQPVLHVARLRRLLKRKTPPGMPTGGGKWALQPTGGVQCGQDPLDLRDREAAHQQVEGDSRPVLRVEAGIGGISQGVAIQRHVISATKVIQTGELAASVRTAFSRKVSIIPPDKGQAEAQNDELQ